jgi:hypothetical protein
MCFAAVAVALFTLLLSGVGKKSFDADGRTFVTSHQSQISVSPVLTKDAIDALLRRLWKIQDGIKGYRNVVSLVVTVLAKV